LGIIYDSFSVGCDWESLLFQKVFYRQFLLPDLYTNDLSKTFNMEIRDLRAVQRL
jgi:hypothetical protein